MKKYRLGLAIFTGCVLLGGVSANTFESDVTSAGWVVNETIFECRLSHPIDYFGEAVFYQRAGEDQRFLLASHTPRLQSGKAALRSFRPEWKKRGSEAKELGFVPVEKGEKPIELDAAMTQRMLEELRQGMQVAFTRRAWYGGDKSLEVGISTVNFNSAYDNYLGCLAGLLPVNFDQIERTSIYFGSDGERLSPSEVIKLDHIGLYSAADPTVTNFYVDGHTDSVGPRAENFELSRERAESVVRALVARGINSESIITRWHGERYPVASNQTRKGRAQNRRVTIRLVRGDEEPKDRLVGR